MKKINIEISNEYKLYRKGTAYSLEGDLIILSGINGSGKSQLLKIIAKNNKEQIYRNVTQTTEDSESISLENILLLSFRDNIDLGNDFGQFSATYRKSHANLAWNFYRDNIKHEGFSFSDRVKTEHFNNGNLLFDNKGRKNPSWRSIIKLIEILKNNFDEEKIFDLDQDDLESVLPSDFLWRNENDIIQQVGNLFYVACCERVNRQIECSRTSDVFDNSQWLKIAPWTILNQLFEELNFKYRFKNDYAFKTPNMEENPKLRDENDIRNLSDLSDGEKAILKLALIALDEEISKDIKLVLFDEYDAPLNPSLTEAFYYVLDKFYIQKGIQIIITTHSPATISLAPDYAQFYEIFSQKNSSPKILKTNQYDYEELKIANKAFYNKIKNQEERILELEHITQLSGNLLLVEDKYDQIYKIAYLKTNGIDDITEENLEEKFKSNCNFSVHGNFSCGGLYNELMRSNTTLNEENKTICLFDFDGEGFRKFKELLKKKENDGKIFSGKNGSIKEGLFVKHSKANRCALMLPIPERLEKYVSEKTSSDCFIEVETLLSEDYLKSNFRAEQRSQALPFYKIKDDHKSVFWKDLLDIDKTHFDDFKPLFAQIEKIFSLDK